MRSSRWSRFIFAASMAVYLLSGSSGAAWGQEKESERLSADAFGKLHKLIKPQTGESRWMEIAWYPTVWEARQKAAAEGKPLFLWAGSGGAPAAGC